jgi:ribosomal protein S18 acetylase RimI-like enzyme
VLGKLCLLYVNYMARKDDTAFEEISISSSDIVEPADLPNLEMRCIENCGGIPELLEVYNTAYVGSVDYRRAGWMQVQALKACREFNPRLAWIAYVNGEPVGFSMARCTNAHGRLTGIGVSPDWRGKGIAHALVSRTLGHLVDAGASTVTASVERDNSRIAAIYHDVGFHRS